MNAKAEINDTRARIDEASMLALQGESIALLGSNMSDGMEFKQETLEAVFYDLARKFAAIQAALDGTGK